MAKTDWLIASKWALKINMSEMSFFHITYITVDNTLKALPSFFNEFHMEIIRGLLWVSLKTSKLVAFYHTAFLRAAIE